MGNNGQRVVETDVFVTFFESFAQNGIADDDVGELQTGHVESFAGGHASDQLRIVGNFGQRNVLNALPEQITVNFIRNQPQIVGGSDGGYLT